MKCIPPALGRLFQPLFIPIDEHKLEYDIPVYNTFENCSFCLKLYTTVFVTFLPNQGETLLLSSWRFFLKLDSIPFRKLSSLENLATLDVEADTTNATFRRIHVIVILIFWLSYFVVVFAYISIFSLCTVCIYTRVFCKVIDCIKEKKELFLNALTPMC